MLAASAANAADFPNACKNSVTANQSQIGVTMTATSPTSVAPGGPVALTNIQQTVSVPGGIFVAGYNLGVLTAGPNTIPTTVATLIEGTNTVEGTQSTNTASTSISTTISDPDGNPGTGDETATDGTLSATYDDQTWTAGGSPGTIDFREDTVPIGAGAGALHTGGVKIVATIGGVINVRFGCSPGTVAGPDPGVVTLDDPAASFATTQVAAAGGLSLGKVKLNKKKGTATLSVEVSGAGKVALKQTSTVTGATKTANAAGTVKLTVKSRGKAKKTLNKKGKVKVKASVTFTPTAGQPQTETKKLKLVKK